MPNPSDTDLQQPQETQNGQQTNPAYRADPASGFPEARTDNPLHPALRQEPQEDKRQLPPRDPETGRFTAEDIQKARSEEKDKLYGRIEEMSEKLKVFEEERQARIDAENAAKEAADKEAEERRREEADLKTLLHETEQTWQEKFDQVQREREAERALLEKERQFNALQQYRSQILEHHEDEILPELRDLVTGGSQEEIDAAVASMKERTERILNQVSAAAGQQRMQMKGASVTAPPVGPTENESSHQMLSAEELANMDMNTYAKNRDRLMSAITQRVGERGLYD